MAPSTRRKDKVDYTRRALEATQQNQNVNQDGQGNGPAPSTHPQSQNTPVNRPKSRPKARDPRVNSEGRSTSTAIRKTPPGSSKQRRSFGWRRTRLPEFDVAKWRIRAGRPVIMLRLLNSDVDTTMTDDPESFEQIEVDTESDHSIPFVNGTDQPQDDVQTPPGHGPPSDDNQSTSDDSGSDYEPPMADEPPKSANEPADVNQPADDDQPAEHGQLPGDEDLPISVSSSDIDPNLKFASDYPALHEDVPERRLPIEGKPREADVTTYGNTFAKFIASPFGLWNKDTGERETGWVGTKPLGKGGYGMAGLWQKTLPDGTVKSIVIKQTRNQWWKGERWDPNVPDEVVALSTIKRQRDIQPTGCIEYFDYQRYPAREVHRIYMEYAPYGDLYRLIVKYRAKKRLIPESFIWDVFWRLSKACLAMSSSRCGRDHYDCGEWVHLDIKPDNVFLAEKGDWDNDSYPFYATAKLGDFNGAACLGSRDLENPLVWKGLGTQGYRPLEQQYFFATNPAFHRQVPNYEQAKRRYRWLKHKEMDHEPPCLGSYTNVWGVGAVIFELMTLKRASNYLYTTRETQKNSTEALPRETCEKIITQLGYSEDLVNLVAACLRPNPTERPTVGAMEEASFEGRFEQYGNLHEWYDEGDAQLDKHLIPWDDLDGMPEGNEWVPSRGQVYRQREGPTAVRVGRSSLSREVKKEKKTPRGPPPPPPQQQQPPAAQSPSQFLDNLGQALQFPPPHQSPPTPSDPTPPSDHSPPNSHSLHAPAPSEISEIEDEEVEWDDWDEMDKGDGRPFGPGTRGEWDAVVGGGGGDEDEDEEEEEGEDAEEGGEGDGEDGGEDE